jgi:hypothetical protein
MKHLKSLTCAVVALVVSLDVWAQGHIAPNGVSLYNLGTSFQVNVIYNPTNLYYTGFDLHQQGTTPPSPYPNTFLFDPIADVGVRAFFVSPNQPVSLAAIQSGAYTELTPTSYVFQSGTPFLLGLYTGNQLAPPVNGIYSDPLFGWAELVNDKGVIELLDGAMAYKAGGIYAGTQTVFDVPEPSVQVLFALACLLVCTRRRKTGSAA